MVTIPLTEDEKEATATGLILSGWKIAMIISIWGDIDQWFWETLLPLAANLPNDLFWEAIGNGRFETLTLQGKAWSNTTKGNLSRLIAVRMSYRYLESPGHWVLGSTAEIRFFQQFRDSEVDEEREIIARALEIIKSENDGEVPAGLEA